MPTETENLQVGAPSDNKKARLIPFELFAPYNSDVLLLGSWNNWEPLPLQPNDDGIWRVEIPLEDGDYEYKFQLTSRSYFAEGETVTVGDPQAIEHTLDSYENSVVRVRDGQRILTSYTWQHDDVPLPSNSDLIIYEMHVGDWRGGAGDSQSEQGTFTGVIEKLDYLAELGITAIELMPVNEFPGEHSWGYAQRSIYAVENSYGTPDELCRLVDECHARGIRVIHDAVYNHMESEAHLSKIDYTYWFYGDNPDEPSLDFGPKFNYEHFDDKLKVFPARQHVLGAMDLWERLFHLDGIRFDCTRALKYFDLLSWFHQEAHKRADFKPFITIAEHIPQDGSISGPDGPMDAAWHENFRYQMVSTILGTPKDGREPFDTGELLRLLDGQRDGFVSATNTVKYIDNHDQERTMYQLGTYANTFDEAAFRRSKLGASLLLTAPGIPMLWMGQEFGQPSPKTLEPQPMQWNLLENELNRGLFDHYAHLIRVRKQNPALRTSNYQPIADMWDRGIIGYKRWNDEGNVVVVVANLRDEYAGEFDIASAGLEDGEWHEVIHNYVTRVEQGRLVDTLGESEVKIYIKAL